MLLMVAMCHRHLLISNYSNGPMSCKRNGLTSGQVGASGAVQTVKLTLVHQQQHLDGSMAVA